MSRNEDISLLPFLGEKHICILFFTLVFTLDNGIRRNIKFYAIGSSEMLYTIQFQLFDMQYRLIGC